MPPDVRIGVFTSVPSQFSTVVGLTWATPTGGLKEPIPFTDLSHDFEKDFHRHTAINNAQQLDIIINSTNHNQASKATPSLSIMQLKPSLLLSTAAAVLTSMPLAANAQQSEFLTCVMGAMATGTITIGGDGDMVALTNTLSTLCCIASDDPTCVALGCVDLEVRNFVHQIIYCMQLVLFDTNIQLSFFFSFVKIDKCHGGTMHMRRSNGCTNGDEGRPVACHVDSCRYDVEYRW